MSKVVPRLYDKIQREKAAAAAAAAAAGGAGGVQAGSSSSSSGWKRELLALSTPLRHFVGRLGLQPDNLMLH
jgi:hypothetical protein